MNNRLKLVNATDNTNAGIMTKSKTHAHDSRMADAKATRTISSPKKHANINANDQELEKVSDTKINLFAFFMILLKEYVVFG